MTAIQHDEFVRALLAAEAADASVDVLLRAQQAVSKYRDFLVHRQRISYSKNTATYIEVLGKVYDHIVRRVFDHETAIPRELVV